MSQQEASNLERRVVALELALNDLYDRLARDEAKLAAAYTQSLMGGMAGGGGGGGSTPIFWAYARSGIAAATVTGSAGSFTLTPGSATCDVYAFNQSANTWYFLNTNTVYNDWVNSGGAGVASGHWVQVYQDQHGDIRVLGEQC